MSARGRRGSPATRDWRFWALLALFGAVLGLHLLTPRLDSDQAVTGLMGWQILRGEFPIFFWSQNHAGVPESYGAAVTFFPFGMSRLALSLVPALAALGLVLLLYRTGAVLFGHEAGLLAILFATVVSPYVAAHYERARAYYIEHLVVGQVVLLGAALWLRSPTADTPLDEPARCRVLIAMGLAGGVGLYFGFQIVAALLPALLALLLVDPRLPLRRSAWLGLAAFLLGSVPFWVYNLTHDWATFAVGERFQAALTPGEAGRHLFLELLPILLGVKDWIGTAPYLPGPATVLVPVCVSGAVLLLATRVIMGLPRLRRSPELAGEAFLVTAAVVAVGIVWYGRYVQVPRYLLPLSPVLALVLARASQLLWRRSRALAVLGVALYLSAVAVGAVRDFPALSPAAWRAYWAERAEDDALFRFLRAQGVTRAYSYEYWLAPRLTFDAGGDIIVAEPFNDRHPPYTRAVDASPHPAYILRSEVDRFANWLRGIQARAQRTRIGPYTVFWDFVAPPDVVALPRAGWTLRTTTGRGEPDALVDGRLRSGWASAKGPAGSAAIDVDLGRPRPVAGLTLITDRAQHGPDLLEVMADSGRGPLERVARLHAAGFAILWRNGAPRTVPGRTLTVRFDPVETRHLRLVDLGDGGNWAVAELFLLAPCGDPDGAAAASDAAGFLDAAQRLEDVRDLGPALLRYREAMRRWPDDPEGYAGFVRLAAEIGLQAAQPAAQAARYASLGLVEEARETYAGLAAAIGPDRTYVELTRRQAELAARAGDLVEARRLDAEASAALVPPHALSVDLGRLVELTGYDATPIRVRPGDTLDVTYYWRWLGSPDAPLAAYVHFRGEPGLRTRFADDHSLPAPIPGLAGGDQRIAERRRVVVPPDAEPGRYRLVAGVWNPVTGSRLRRWWWGLVPTLDSAVELGSIEVVPRP